MLAVSRQHMRMQCQRTVGSLQQVIIVTETDMRTPADLNSVTSDCDQVFIDLSSARSTRLLCLLPNGPRLRERATCRNLMTQRQVWGTLILQQLWQQGCLVIVPEIGRCLPRTHSPLRGHRRTPSPRRLVP
jgi:hypothetical protein